MWTLELTRGIEQGWDMMAFLLWTCRMLGGPSNYGPWWEVEMVGGGKEKRQGPGPALPLCYLHYLDKVHHFSELCYLIEDMRVNLGYLLFLLSETLLFSSHDLHPPPIYKPPNCMIGSKQGYNFEESNQGFHWTGAMKKFVGKNWPVFCFTKEEKVWGLCDLRWLF